MAVDFSNAESLLVTQLRTLDFLDEDNCKAGETDVAFEHADSHNENFVCVTDYLGGSMQGRGIWGHEASVLFAIRVVDAEQIETDVRKAVDDFLGLMLPENRLASGVDAIVSNGQKPLVGQRNNYTWVYLQFTVTILESCRANC